ncbi:MAG: SDR family NAD(P)-dependent oxidoreductase [Bacteroidia bacterium]
MGLLSGKTAIITGASSGIGKAIAELFAREGADLVLLSLNYEELQGVHDSLTSKFTGKYVIYQADVRNAKQLKEVFNDIHANGIVPDILVNNAGINKDMTLQMAKPDVIEDIYATNVFGTMYCSQLSLRFFMKKKNGSIINLSSIVGKYGNIGQSIYGSSKAAVIGFTKSLSKELASLNIRVNAIAPGLTDTGMAKRMSEKFYRKNVSMIGMKRIGKPEDVAKVALFLASDLSQFVTGQVIGVDGSMVI